MSHGFNHCRPLARALADLREKYDRTPEDSHRERLLLERMIEALDTEIAERQARDHA
jgi:hypothetical protein